jgi:hypothetical protein
VRNLALLGLLAVLAGTLSAQAPVVVVNSNIDVSTVWTSNNQYKLEGQIFVLPGATLTIEAGTVIASDSTGGLEAGLAVTNGAQINVLGTEDNPVIMTSVQDVATWTGGDPKTGTWRESADEWGNLTIMGDAYIGGLGPGNSNASTPNANNIETMEGLVVPPSGGASLIQYGGGDDDYDAGTINYLSIRYGGQVLALTSELNGLSLGGLGRDTDMHHIEIMNNIDDGIEIWGGTLNLKYFSVWNVGDDSLDCDQGWRGKAQFGLIVQGFSLNTGSGGGVGDNAIEMDGAEDPDFQPVTTSAIANITVIGQPGAPGAVGGDDGIALRDNANLQVRNCILMDIGDDVYDGNGNENGGYAFGGSLTEVQRTTTLASMDPNGTNAPANLADFYQAQDPTGTLIEVSNTVVFNGTGSDGNGYNEWDSFWNGAGLNNTKEALTQPIVSISRNGPELKGGRVMFRVLSLDPRPAGDALNVGSAAFPNDNFFAPVTYAGAFAENENWLCGWTASEAFGFTPGAAAAEAGQPATAASALDINIAHNIQCEPAAALSGANGPYYTTTDGEAIEFSFFGNPNQPVILWEGALDPGLIANLGGAGSIDVGTASGVGPFFFNANVVLDGSNPSNFFDFFATTGPMGQNTIVVPGGVLPPGTQVSFQAAIGDPASSVVFTTSNAVSILVN